MRLQHPGHNTAITITKWSALKIPFQTPRFPWETTTPDCEHQNMPRKTPGFLCGHLTTRSRHRHEDYQIRPQTSGPRHLKKHTRPNTFLIRLQHPVASIVKHLISRFFVWRVENISSIYYFSSCSTALKKVLETETERLRHRRSEHICVTVQNLGKKKHCWTCHYKSSLGLFSGNIFPSRHYPL